MHQTRGYKNSNYTHRNAGSPQRSIKTWEGKLILLAATVPLALACSSVRLLRACQASHQTSAPSVKPFPDRELKFTPAYWPEGCKFINENDLLKLHVNVIIILLTYYYEQVHSFAPRSFYIFYEDMPLKWCEFLGISLRLLIYYLEICKIHDVSEAGSASIIR
jgi:hypothetical protein